MMGVTRDDVKIVINFFLDWIIASGSISAGAMLEVGTASIPHQTVLIFSLLAGCVLAARRAQAAMDGKPQEALQDTVKQLVAQMRTVQVATAQAVAPEPVTPKRVEPPPNTH